MQQGYTESTNKELIALKKAIELGININSMERHTNTPVYLISEYLVDCYKSYELLNHKKIDRQNVLERTSTEPLNNGTTKIPGKLNAKEALYGFVGWLTARQTPTTMPASTCCSALLNLIEEFAKANNLSEVSENWDKNLIHPQGECSHIND